MTRNEITESAEYQRAMRKGLALAIDGEYSVSDITDAQSAYVTSPGKFELEPVAALYFYDLVMSGMADNTLETFNGNVFVFHVAHAFVLLREDEQGFARLEFCDDAELMKLEAESILASFVNGDIDDAETINDPADLDTFEGSECFYVNDHGNASYYVRGHNGKFYLAADCV
jgi:hypothetical protein